MNDAGGLSGYTALTRPTMLTALCAAADAEAVMIKRNAPDVVCRRNDMHGLLYRGVDSQMFREQKGQVFPRGNQSTAELFPGEHLFPSERLIPGKHSRNAIDKHQNRYRFNEANFKSRSAYISTTPQFDRAQYYATSKHTSGYVFVIDRNLLKEHGVSEYLVADIATLITIPEDEEVLLLTNPLGTPLPKEVILEVREVQYAP